MSSEVVTFGEVLLHLSPRDADLSGHRKPRTVAPMDVRSALIELVRSADE